MSTFASPEHVYVINEALQSDVKFYDTNNVLVTVFNAGHKVNFTPVFTDVKKSDVKVALKTLSSPGTAQVATLKFNSGALAGDNIRVRVMFNSLEHLGVDVASVNNDTPYVVDYVATSSLTPAQLATKIANLFNATNGYPFTVSVASDTLTFTANKVGYAFSVHTGNTNTTFTIITNAVNPIGTYGAILPNFNNIYQHGDLQKMPLGDLANKPQVGVTYVMYYWETESTEKIGGHSAHSSITNRFHRYRVYVNSSLTALIAELDKIVP